MSNAPSMDPAKPKTDLHETFKSKQKINSNPRIGLNYFQVLTIKYKLYLVATPIIILLLISYIIYSYNTKDPLEVMLTSYFAKPRNDLESHQDYKNRTQNFIKEYFAEYTDEQHVFSYLREYKGRKIQVHNIIGISRGKKFRKPGNTVVLFGAHYDTYNETPGVNDNGSGVVTLLQLLKKLAKHRNQLEMTLSFIAFDQEEQSFTGSATFLEEFFVPKIILNTTDKPNFVGAFILDQVMNYDLTVDSQQINDLGYKFDSKAAEWIKNNDNKGDFLCLIGRLHKDDRLINMFYDAWSTLFDMKIYKLGPLRPEIPNLANDIVRYKYFRTSAHFSFWEAEEKFNISLPAILITDTGSNRGRQKDCYHKECDDIRQINHYKLSWLHKIVDTLYDIVITINDELVNTS